MKGARYISIILTIIQIIPLRVYGAAQNKTTAAVVAVRSGVNFENTELAADKLRNVLDVDFGFHVVDKKKMEDVLNYHVQKNDTEKININDLLANAKEKYYQFDYVNAKSLAQKAASSLKNSVNSIAERGDVLIDAYLTLGIICHSMGNTVEARQAFYEALRLDPEYKLDGRAFSPRTVAMFEEVRTSLVIEPRGEVYVASTPKVAEVYLNGVLKGVTPIAVGGLPEGVHHLKISANKYQTVKKEIFIKGGETIKVKERLAWKGDVADGQIEYFDKKTDSPTSIENALQISRLLKVDKVILLDAEQAANGAGLINAQMIDSFYRAGQKPINVSYRTGDLDGAINRLAESIVDQSNLKIASNPEKYLEPPGYGDPRLIGDKKQSKISKGVLFGILGGILAIGLGAGLAAALGGGPGGAGAGSLNVTFR